MVNTAAVVTVVIRAVGRSTGGISPAVIAGKVGGGRARNEIGQDLSILRG